MRFKQNVDRRNVHNNIIKSGDLLRWRPSNGKFLLNPWLLTSSFCNRNNQSDRGGGLSLGASLATVAARVLSTSEAISLKAK